ncbi:MAG: hypothetical protein LHW62_07225, partial [Candidatus Cloacimonetes bacterium]|nr:hypothetical protein [Candidatus Cloacimonadota bacterium]
PEEEGLDWNIAELVAETLWDGKMFSTPQNGYAILWGLQIAASSTNKQVRSTIPPTEGRQLRTKN